MRAFPLLRPLAPLAILFLVAVAPLAGQQRSSDRNSSDRETRAAPVRQEVRPAAESPPARSSSMGARSGSQGWQADRTGPAARPQRPVSRSATRSQPDTRFDHGAHIRAQPDGHRNRARNSPRTFDRRDRSADRSMRADPGMRSERRNPRDAAVRAEGIERFIRSDHGPTRVELIDRNATAEDKAEVLEAVLRLVGDRTNDTAEPVRGERDPNEDTGKDRGDLPSGPRHPKDGDDGSDCGRNDPCDVGEPPSPPPGGRPGAGDDKGDDEPATPPLVAQPIPANVNWLAFFYRTRFGSMPYVARNCRYDHDVFGRTLRPGGSSLRDPLWHGRISGADPWFDYDIDCGIEYGPTYSWDAYAARMDDEVADCAVVIVQHHDDAAVSFHVDLPALGADTPSKLRKAIKERLDRGETVSLAVTLTPDQVKAVDVRACDRDDG